MAHLSVQDSLSRTKTPLLLGDPGSKKITWYACGPTVYDDAHIGHARNYVSTDIIRRILQDYFDYHVQFVMNITDVDDKIIIAARQRHLLDRWWSQHTLLNDEVRNATATAYGVYVRDNLPGMSQPSLPEAYTDNAMSAYGHVIDGKSVANDGSPPGEDEAKIRMHLAIAKSACEALSLPAESQLDDFKAKAGGVLLPYVDSLHKHQIKADDHEIFNRHAKHYEDRFFEDMRDLNVLAPDNLTRVTEYIPKIINFVKQIEDNKLAYKLEHEASVYFDIDAFELSGGRYSKLQAAPKPGSNLAPQIDTFSAAKNAEYKRSGADFALWKASKEGEPSWDSPWGRGRPGWHIECSAMASDVLGRQMDIHSGGIDLAFPHHENELVQSEAYWKKPGEEIRPWVKYFLHMGHLHIEGYKMSKSLKNFITIRDALSRKGWTARRLRIVFLRGAWREGFDFTSDAVVNTAAGWEERADGLFLKVRDLKRRSEQGPVTYTGETDSEPTDLEQTFKAKQEALHVALLNSFDTQTAMSEISALITAYNVAYKEQRISEVTSTAIGNWITKIVVMFGLDAHYKVGQMGWSGIDLPVGAEPFVYQLSELRDRVRERAKANPVGHIDVGIIDQAQPRNSFAAAYADFQREISDLQAKDASSNAYLSASDRLRDSTLWDLGVYIEDLHDGRGLVRPISATLEEQKLQTQANAARIAAAKQKAQAEAAAAERARLEKGKLSPAELFRSSPEFSAWDENGLPTKDSEGKELTKSKAKKVQKDWERQKKLHLAYLASLSGEPSLIEGRRK